ncbi:TetR/AcrR family transcriptional regulator [Deinococcus altitudinis]|uniref:TetR/AcrR family transcriptional regulator n=1 Tax=Deinococcus altitudinis TaxID=468914 RepID=UPI003891E533
MPTPPDRRSRKRLATREAISDAATRLFAERGFDQVTVEEIATAADVGRKTVFNHFPRKEDMFFDRIEEFGEILQGALQQRDSRFSSVEALRQLAHRLVAEDSYYVNFSAVSHSWIETMVGSETLQARARAIRDETAQMIAEALAEAAGQTTTDPSAVLAAGLLMATWTVAFVQARRTFQQQGDAVQAQAVFLAIIDQGTVGIDAAMQGTPYV